MRPPDALFADPRLAVLYDALDGDRADLGAYEALLDEAGASSVVDIGCGTGCLAVRLAARGIAVVGVDPAEASLDVAREKPHAHKVSWLAGDATALSPLDLAADLAVMTGNVAQVFVSDEDWEATLNAVHGSLRPGGWLVFETRRPEARAWEEWDVAPTAIEIPNVGTVEVTRTVTEVNLPWVTFTSTTVVGGESLSSTSTLRFRQQSEVERDLDRCGFEVLDVREAPDRPGQELVFVVQSR